MNPSCPLCRGTGRYREPGFDGPTMRDCPDCTRPKPVIWPPRYGSEPARRRPMAPPRRHVGN